MQNNQMAPNFVAMNANAGGPVDGTPMMGNMQRPRGEAEDPRSLINTYIYDYFLRNQHHELAELMLKSEMKMNIQLQGKQSPGSRNVNGVDGMNGMEMDDKFNLPHPKLPSQQAVDNSFLLDWWNQFWDIFGAARKRSMNPKAMSYIQAFRTMSQHENNQRQQRMMMNANGNGMAPFNNMVGRMPNGVAPNDLKRAAVNNRNPNGAGPMANMNQMKSHAMMGAQMQRDGSQMDMNGQRPQSPGSAENEPSPNKRPRVEGNFSSSPRMGAARPPGMPQLPIRATLPGQADQMMFAGAMNAANMAGNQFGEFAPGQNGQQKSLEVYAQSLAQQQRHALNNHGMVQGMNPGAQGSPMNPGLEGQDSIFAGNQPRPGMPPNAGPPQGNHALQDYQMQLMLLEQQNKKRLLMARQEQDNITAGPHGQPVIGGPGYSQAMSPQGSRAGPSPNPSEQMKRGTPKLNQPGLPPGSPMPDMTMQNARSSPAPNMVNFDPTGMPPGVPPQLGYGQMQQSPMMRPPSSHPGFNGQQISPQQLEAMRQSGVMPNGWRGPGGPQAMMQGPGQQMGGPMQNPQQRHQQMPPPPAPPAGEQPRPEPSPSQPTPQPNPTQANKANPKKKNTKDNKKPNKAKGANATPAASGEDPPPTPTPSTPIAPITPMNPKSFGMNGQPAQPSAQPQQTAPAPPSQSQPPMDQAFGNLEDINDPLGFGDFTEGVETFDFESFLHVEDPTGLGFGGDFDFGSSTVEAGGDL